MTNGNALATKNPKLRDTTMMRIRRRSNDLTIGIITRVINRILETNDSRNHVSAEWCIKAGVDALTAEVMTNQPHRIRIMVTSRDFSPFRLASKRKNPISVGIATTNAHGTFAPNPHKNDCG